MENNKRKLIINLKEEWKQWEQYLGGYSNLSFEKEIEDLKAENEKLKAEIQRIGSVGRKSLWIW